MPSKTPEDWNSLALASHEVHSRFAEEVGVVPYSPLPHLVCAVQEVAV